MENVPFPSKDRVVKEMSRIYLVESFIFDKRDTFLSHMLQT